MTERGEGRLSAEERKALLNGSRRLGESERDRLARVAAEIVVRREREAAERAWSDGYNDAATMARCYGHTDYWEDEPDNPYAALASGRAASGADSEEGQR